MSNQDNAEFTDEIFELYLKFKTFIFNSLKEVEKVSDSESIRIFAVADILCSILTGIKSTDPQTFLYILNRVTKGEQHDERNSSDNK